MIKKVHDVLIYQRTYHKDIATRFSQREGFEDLVFTSKTNNPIKTKQIISKNPDLGDCRSYCRVIHECTWWIARTGNGIRGRQYRGGRVRRSGHRRNYFRLMWS